MPPSSDTTMPKSAPYHILACTHGLNKNCGHRCWNYSFRNTPPPSVSDARPSAAQIRALEDAEEVLREMQERQRKQRAEDERDGVSVERLRRGGSNQVSYADADVLQDAEKDKEGDAGERGEMGEMAEEPAGEEDEAEGGWDVIDSIISDLADGASSFEQTAPITPKTPQVSRRKQQRANNALLSSLKMQVDTSATTTASQLSPSTAQPKSTAHPLTKANMADANDAKITSPLPTPLAPQTPKRKHSTDITLSTPNKRPTPSPTPSPSKPAKPSTPATAQRQKLRQRMQTRTASLSVQRRGGVDLGVLARSAPPEIGSHETPDGMKLEADMATPEKGEDGLDVPVTPKTEKREAVDEVTSELGTSTLAEPKERSTGAFGDFEDLILVVQTPTDGQASDESTRVFGDLEQSTPGTVEVGDSVDAELHTMTPRQADDESTAVFGNSKDLTPRAAPKQALAAAYAQPNMAMDIGADIDVYPTPARGASVPLVATSLSPAPEAAAIPGIFAPAEIGTSAGPTDNDTASVSDQEAPGENAWDKVRKTLFPIPSSIAKAKRREGFEDLTSTTRSQVDITVATAAVAENPQENEEAKAEEEKPGRDIYHVDSDDSDTLPDLATLFSPKTPKPKAQAQPPKQATSTAKPHFKTSAKKPTLKATTPSKALKKPPRKPLPSTEPLRDKILATLSPALDPKTAAAPPSPTTLLASESKLIDALHSTGALPHPTQLVCGREIYVHDLYTLVQKHGGYEKVENADLWRLVAGGVGFEGRSLEGASRELRGLYREVLLAVERPAAASVDEHVPGELAVRDNDSVSSDDAREAEQKKGFLAQLATRGISPIQTILGVEIELHLLWLVVYKLGGFVRVEDDEAWDRVAKMLLLPDTAIDAPDEVQRVYTELLRGLEDDVLPSFSYPSAVQQVAVPKPKAPPMKFKPADVDTFLAKLGKLRDRHGDKYDESVEICGREVHLFDAYVVVEHTLGGHNKVIMHELWSHAATLLDFDVATKAEKSAGDSIKMLWTEILGNLALDLVPIPPKQKRNDGKGDLRGALAKKKSRLSKADHEKLEKVFQGGNGELPKRDVKEALAREMGVRCDTVNNWFYSRRVKAKREKTKRQADDGREVVDLDAEPAGSTTPREASTAERAQRRCSVTGCNRPRIPGKYQVRAVLNALATFADSEKGNEAAKEYLKGVVGELIAISEDGGPVVEEGAEEADVPRYMVKGVGVAYRINRENARGWKAEHSCGWEENESGATEKEDVDGDITMGEAPRPAVVDEQEGPAIAAPDVQAPTQQQNIDGSDANSQVQPGDKYNTDEDGDIKMVEAPLFPPMDANEARPLPPPEVGAQHNDDATPSDIDSSPEPWDHDIVIGHLRHKSSADINAEILQKFGDYNWDSNKSVVPKRIEEIAPDVVVGPLSREEEQLVVGGIAAMIEGHAVLVGCDEVMQSIENGGDGDSDASLTEGFDGAVASSECKDEIPSPQKDDDEVLMSNDSIPSKNTSTEADKARESKLAKPSTPQPKAQPTSVLGHFVKRRAKTPAKDLSTKDAGTKEMPIDLLSDDGSNSGTLNEAVHERVGRPRERTPVVEPGMKNRSSERRGAVVEATLQAILPIVAPKEDIEIPVTKAHRSEAILIEDDEDVPPQSSIPVPPTKKSPLDFMTFPNGKPLVDEPAALEALEADLLTPAEYGVLTLLRAGHIEPEGFFMNCAMYAGEIDEVDRTDLHSFFVGKQTLQTIVRWMRDRSRERRLRAISEGRGGVVPQKPIWRMLLTKLVKCVGEDGKVDQEKLRGLRWGEEAEAVEAGDARGGGAKQNDSEVAREVIEILDDDDEVMMEEEVPNYAY